MNRRHVVFGLCFAAMGVGIVLAVCVAALGARGWDIFRIVFALSAVSAVALLVCGACRLLLRRAWVRFAAGVLGSYIILYAGAFVYVIVGGMTRETAPWTIIIGFFALPFITPVILTAWFGTVIAIPPTEDRARVFDS